MNKIFLALIIAGLFVSGCAHKGVVKEDQSLQQKQVSTTDQKTKDKQLDGQAGKKMPQEDVSANELANKPPVDSLSLIKALQAKIRDIHFDFDKYFIRTDEKPILNEVASTLGKNGNLKVTIEGNCDEKGTTEYNLALGDRRAVAAKEYLLSQGIQSERMDTLSNGKEKPLCTESTESCWAKNRRDHFVLDVTKN